MTYQKYTASKSTSSNDAGASHGYFQEPPRKEIPYYERRPATKANYPKQQQPEYLPKQKEYGRFDECYEVCCKGYWDFVCIIICCEVFDSRGRAEREFDERNRKPRMRP